MWMARLNQEDGDKRADQQRYSDANLTTDQKVGSSNLSGRTLA